MLGWLFGNRKRRDEEMLLALMSAAAEGERRQESRNHALAIARDRKLSPDDGDETGSSLPSLLAGELVLDAARSKGWIGRPLSGGEQMGLLILTIIASDAISQKIGGAFEAVSLGASIHVLIATGAPLLEEAGRLGALTGRASDAYNDLAMQSLIAPVMTAAGESALEWLRTEGGNGVDVLSACLEALVLTVEKLRIA